MYALFLKGTPMTDSRINMRISSKKHEEIRAAAQLAEQDVTSFMIDAAMEKAERLLASSNVIKITAVEALGIERLLKENPAPNARLTALLNLTRNPKKK
jgi:uncharacterized protein (DUF1778 family)